MSVWIVTDPFDFDKEFDNQAEAIAHAEHLIEMACEDGTWAEEVSDVRVAHVTHTACRTVVAVRSEMGDHAFEALTGDQNGCSEWWDYSLTPTYPHVGGES